MNAAADDDSRERERERLYLLQKFYLLRKPAWSSSLLPLPLPLLLLQLGLSEENRCFWLQTARLVSQLLV